MTPGMNGQPPPTSDDDPAIGTLEHFFGPLPDILYGNPAVAGPHAHNAPGSAQLPPWHRQVSSALSK
jgi:hypothetical protein